ncbi:MAG: substrate-binding domain-containing protein, partial [Actinomadura sp.]
MSGRHGNENPGGMPGDERRYPDTPHTPIPEASSAGSVAGGYAEWFGSGAAGSPPPAAAPDGFPRAADRGANAQPTGGHHTGGYDAPGYGTPGYGTPGYDTGGYGTPGYDTAGHGPGSGDSSGISRGGYSLDARTRGPADNTREPRGPAGGHGPSGYGPSGYGPSGYGPSGYGAGSPGHGGYDYGGPGGGSGGGPSGRGSRSDRKRRRSAGALIGPMAGAVGLALLLGVAAYAIAQRGTCTGGDAISLNVTAAPDIAPAVTATVKRFNDQRREVGGHCVRATVRSADPASVTTLLSGQGVTGGTTERPDVWIPDSSMWTSLVRTSEDGRDAVKVTKTSLAQTPVVVGMPRTLAGTLRSQGVIESPSWDNLLKAVGGTAGGAVTKNQMIPADLIRLQVLDPIRNAGGMASLMLTRTLLTNDPNA